MEQNEMQPVYLELFNPSIFNAMSDFVRIVDERNRILFENDSLQKFFAEHYPISETTGALYETDKLFPLSMAQSVFSTGCPLMTEFCVASRVFSVKCSPLYENDDLRSVIEVYRDITIANRFATRLFGENQRLQQEMTLARSIQRSMLPRLTDFGKIHFTYRYIPSSQLSGDFFDLIPLGEGRLGMYITDVVGHGVSASILTMFVRQTMRNILEEDRRIEPAEVLARVRQRFNEINLDDGQYFSLFYAVIDTYNETMTYANAGHNCPPILFKNGKATLLETPGMLISTIFENYDYEQHCIDFDEDLRILFYTDGIIESENQEGEMFGIQGLEKAFYQKEKPVLEEIISRVHGFRSGEQKDDIALLLVDIPKRENG